MRARALLAAGIAAVAAAAAGCGEDKPTKAEYISQVDRICRKTRRAEAPAARSLRVLLTRAQQARGNRATLARLSAASRPLNTVVKEERKSLEEIKGISKPDGEDGEGADRFIKSSERDIGLLGDLESAIRSRDLAGLQRVGQQLEARRGETGRIARDYGFRVCGGAG